MAHRISVRRILLGSVVALVLVVAATAIAETASRAMRIEEVYTAIRPSRGVPETRQTSFQRNSGFIFCFVRIDNPSGDGNEILVAFEPAAGEPASAVRGIRLRIPARYSYRTVARTGSDMAAGTHRCVVRSRAGEVLSHVDFQVTE